MVLITATLNKSVSQTVHRTRGDLKIKSTLL